MMGLHHRWGQPRKGDKKMKKTVWMLVMVFMVLALSVPVQAGPLTMAGGDWLYMPTVVSVRVAGGNTFLELSEV